MTYQPEGATASVVSGRPLVAPELSMRVAASDAWVVYGGELPSYDLALSIPDAKRAIRTALKAGLGTGMPFAFSRIPTGWRNPYKMVNDLAFEIVSIRGFYESPDAEIDHTLSRMIKALCEAGLNKARKDRPHRRVTARRYGRFINHN